MLISWAGLVGGRRGAGKRGCGEMAQRPLEGWGGSGQEIAAGV